MSGWLNWTKHYDLSGRRGNGPFPNGYMHGVVLHVNVSGPGSEGTSPQWYADGGGPDEVCPNFQVMTTGETYQFLPINWQPWTQRDGNNWGPSIETGGDPDEPLTDAQIRSCGAIMRAIHEQYGVPLQVTDDTDNRGLGTHQMGGYAWGGHPCVPLDTTDVLTPNGWKRLADVTFDDQVASWDPDSGLIDFAHPLGITPSHYSDTVRMHWLETTANHRMYIRKSLHGPYKVVRADEMRINDRVPLAGELADTPGLPVNDDMLRLLVQVQADGHYTLEGDRRVGLEFHFRKQRKIDHVTVLLSRLGVTARVGQQSDGTIKIKVRDEAWLEHEILPLLPDKMFTWEWLAMTGEQFVIFAEELMLGDGCESRQIYRSRQEQNLEVVQALYHLHNRRATRDKHGDGLGMTKSDAFRDRVASMCFYRKAPEAGRGRVLVGCLVTEHETLLVRQNGRAAIIGNCPGRIRANQRKDILAVARGVTDPFDELMEQLMSWYKSKAEFESAMTGLMEKAVEAKAPLQSFNVDSDGEKHRLGTFLAGIPGYQSPPDRRAARKKAGK